MAADDSNLARWLSSNASYQQEFESKSFGTLSGIPQRLAFILTCIDTRLVPYDAMGLEIGQFHVYRNAGGRVTDDAIRSFSMTQQLMGTKEIYVMHHTKCGVEGRTDKDVVEIIRKNLGEAAAKDAEKMQFHTCASARDSVADDVRLLKESKLITPGTIVGGLLFDVETGAIEVICEPEPKR